MIKQKRAAIELSIGTIVIIVIAMSMLILGIVLVRQIMCAGIVLTDQVTDKTENEIKGLFSSKEYGMKCMGEEGNEVKIGGGGRRQVVCVITEDKGGTYEIGNIEANYRRNGQDVDASQIIFDDLSGDRIPVAPGTKTITIVVLDVPRDVSADTVRIDFDVTKSAPPAPDRHTERHTLYLELVPTGSFTAAIC